MSFRLPFLRLMVQRLDCPVFAVRWGIIIGMVCVPGYLLVFVIAWCSRA